MRKILGLDLGTNSIGWALVNQNFENKEGEILGLGSRIIPMDQGILGDFDKGNSVSQTAERTRYRGMRRLRERFLLRRERLHRVLNTLGFLPPHYASQIDFTKRFGKFIADTKPKLAYDGREFIFKQSFEEMLLDFKQNQPQLFYIKPNGEETKIPYDWTIYYLRKKALTEKITQQELAWILLNFNQKRGYYQLRGEEEEENPNKRVEFYSLKIVDVKADETPNKKGETWYSLILENGWVYRRSSKVSLEDWKDKTREFIVTTDLNDDGSIKTDKDGVEKRSFRAPSEGDWNLIKKRTEHEIEFSQKTVGAYIYDTLLQNPNQKIKGKLVRTIERKFYKQELEAILKKQIELQPELFTEELFGDCVRELYKNNELHRDSLSGKDFLHLFIKDIIFYQRPLKSQKSNIGNCTLEFRIFKDNETGIEHKTYLKGIPKSNPYYQEFRVLQWMSNLKIYIKNTDEDKTPDFLRNTEDYEALFDFLMSQKEVNYKDVLEYLLTKSLRNKYPDAKDSAIKKELKQHLPKYRWNFVYDEAKDESKSYPMNETGYEISRRLAKVEGVKTDLDFDKLYALWHILYSVNDKVEYEKALKKFAVRNGFDESLFIENFINFKPFKSEYGSFSEKAIKKLLPLMRFGKNWKYEEISEATQKRILAIITGEDSDDIKTIVREKAQKYQLENETDFQGLPLWLAQYVVYGRHSESANLGKWASSKELEKFLNEFKQHSLRNPIVEQVVTETLRVVKDIWEQYGEGKENFFDEIHIELGRDMKRTAKERDRMSKENTKNENTNERIRALLMELKNDTDIENVRPYSPMQQEILKIYEDGVLSLFSEEELKKEGDKKEEIYNISKKAEPTSSELQRYKLWLEQKYRSPYTGQPISLSRLFTEDYQIEHIVPQSRYFDDSFSNKVICEAAVNKLKDNQLGLEFIQKNYGRKVELGLGKTVTIFTEEEYRDFVAKHYENNKSKRNKLLMDEIPEKMIERQMNDTRYISKYISEILSNVVRANQNDDGVNSKNLVPFNGKITTRLKQDWGLNDVWNELILPRFKRLNTMFDTDAFTAYSENHQKMLPTVPFEHSKGFQKKRIDHRHHAMDALVIACATRDHINLLNNQSAKSDIKRYDLQYKLRKTEKYFNQKENREKDAFKDFYKPWETFTQDARAALEQVVISFKQNLRVINKATNYYEKLEKQPDGSMKKVKVEQKGVNWAIRKPLHKETVSGLVQLDRIKLGKGEKLTATRKSLDTTFTRKSIESITDTGIQKILINYLEYKENDPEKAFSPEGIEELNKNIENFNDGKKHQPILKVRVFEKGSKFPLSELGTKATKYVEAAKGTNLFFAVYENKNKGRSFATIPLNEVIERQKQGLSSCPETNEKGDRLLFSLSPNDLVYVPTPDEAVETIDFNNLTKEQLGRVYKFVSCTGGEGHFIPNINASEIIKNENGTNSKSERIQDFFDGATLFDDKQKPIMIKMFCIKLKVDRLGNIKM